MMISKIKFCIVFVLANCIFFVKPSLAQNAASELFELGQTAANQGDVTKAIDFYEKSIEADPDFVSAYSALALIYLDQGADIDDIIWLFQQAANLEPQNAQHYANMCRAYFQYQKHDWAQSACLKALSLDPNAGGAKLTLAWVYLFGKSQPAEAIKYFKEIVEKVPNPKVYYGLGMAYARNNEQGNALDIITTLRGMGEETLASQLERMIRSTGEPAVSMPIHPLVEAGPSKIVKGKPAEPPPVQAAPASVGKIRIQLRARLPSAENDQVGPSGSKTDKDVSDETYGPEDYPQLSVQERMERVRRMRGQMGRASGRGTVSTQTRAAQ